ncbi:MAG: hypothetical protein P8L16_06950 [Ilumatobacter sp.]|nr:hypothetical protein [Ilumatobacter sp.]
MEIAVDHRTPLRAAPPARTAGPNSRRRSAVHDEALRDVLAELGERVKPIALAQERTLPVAAPFGQLLPDGLVRGQVVSCRGAAARSMAFGLARKALVEGGWMAVVDVPTLGTDAAAEFGVPLERVVRIDTGIDADEPSGIGLDWIDVMGAAVDGFDLVLTCVPAALRNDRRPAAVRKLGSRLQQRGAVMVTLGAPGALGGDIELTTQRTVWVGLGDGTGHLHRRVIDVEASGRRMPGRRSCSIELIGEGARVRFGSVSASDVKVPYDPPAEVLAEMTGTVTITDLNDPPLAVG